MDDEGPVVAVSGRPLKPKVVLFHCSPKNADSSLRA